MSGDAGDAVLVAAWRAGDRSAFDRLVERFEPRLMSYLTQITRSRSEAEDLFQETFLRVFRERSSLDPLVPFAFHVLRIGRNLAVSGARRAAVERRGLAVRSGSAPAASRDPAEPVLAGERQAEIARALAGLPEELREVVTLKIWGGLDWSQVGELMGFSPDTAARRFAEAVRRLSRDLGEVGP